MVSSRINEATELVRALSDPDSRTDGQAGSFRFVLPRSLEGDVGVIFSSVLRRQFAHSSAKGILLLATLLTATVHET